MSIYTLTQQILLHKQKVFCYKSPKKVFLVNLVFLNEALGAGNIIKAVLQKEYLQLSSVPVLIYTSINDLKNTSDQCVSNDENNSIHKYINTLIIYVGT